MQLHYAAARGDIDAVGRLLGQGAPVDAPDLQGCTPLIVAAGDRRAGGGVLDLLLTCGADPNARSNRLLVTPLRSAAKLGAVDKVRVLLAAGARAADVDEKGYRPLIDAAYGRGPDLLAVLRLLLDAGADPSGVTSYSESPVRVLSNPPHLAALRLLLDAGADPDQLGWTPLHQPVAFGSAADVAARVADASAVAARDWWERTPWLLSLAIGDVAKAAILLQAGASLSLPTRRQRGRPGGCRTGLRSALSVA